MALSVRKAMDKDLQEVVSILNQGIRTRHSIGFYHSQTVEDMSPWYYEHLNEERYPILVAEDEDLNLAGWISLTPYRKGREAFNRTVEISSYIREDLRRTGVAQTLVDAAMEFAKENGFRTVFAIVLHKNLASVRFLEKNNFERWAYLPEVAEIDGVLLDHVYYGKLI